MSTYRESGTKRVFEVTGGAGLDVVFDGVGGEIGRAAFGVTARVGRFSAAVYICPIHNFLYCDMLEFFR
ncbi:hypothetical protein ACFQZE_04455 [Paenibacillus sp. GCM10027627]